MTPREAELVLEITKVTLESVDGIQEALECIFYTLIIGVAALVGLVIMMVCRGGNYD